MTEVKVKTIKGEKAAEIKAFLESLCSISRGDSREIDGFEFKRLR